METQNTLIRNYLENGNSITPLDALKLFGCFRLSARIHDLRSQGMVIQRNMITSNGKTFASYRKAYVK
jgi:hypothetical protein